jgi:hypothetical protein
MLDGTKEAASGSSVPLMAYLKYALDQGGAIDREYLGVSGVVVTPKSKEASVKKTRMFQRRGCIALSLCKWRCCHTERLRKTL